MTNTEKTVVIVGAGVGGLGVAARLAHAGVRVVVCEKNGFLGGRCSLIHHNGHRFDQGPSLLLVPELFHETYADLGTSFQQEGIELVQCQPNYTIHFHDGKQFTVSTDLSVMKEQLEAYEGKAGFESFLGFMKEAHQHYELSLEHVLHKNFHSLFSMLRWDFLSNVFRLHPFQSMYARASVYFKTERLRRVFTFASMYMGMSPFDAPGTYSLLQYTEFARGIWYPIGGFHVVIAALAQIARRKGAIIRPSTPVSRILYSGRGTRARATGVALESGETIIADAVVVNADLIWAYNHLFSGSSPKGPAHDGVGDKCKMAQECVARSKIERYATGLNARDTSCSSISFFWGLSKRLAPPPLTAAAADNATILTSSPPSPSPLTAHNIFLASAYQDSFSSIFRSHSIPTEPSFYVNIPSLLDRSAAPDEESETVVVLVPVGSLKSEEWTGIKEGDLEARQRLIDRVKDQVLKTIRERTGEDWSGTIKHELVNDPFVWKERFNLDRGAILGLSHSFFNVLSFRPSTMHPYIDSCFFVGASTHPGTGVPIVLAGAKLTAEQVLKSLDLPIPWTHAAYSYRPGPSDASSSSFSDLDETHSRFGSVAVLFGLVGMTAAILAVVVNFYG
ncbi:phytoene desaturase [Clavulina sp. PMI_390]|nr:phytoene desaturase [Clavulina sp. PMI_390]